jgi:WD40 repeat protein
MSAPEARRWPAAILSATLLLAAQVAARPEAELRADHMVLDGALRGSLLLAATQSGHLDAFDWRQGRALAPLLVIDAGKDEFPPTVRCVAVSPSGARAAAAASDDRLRVWSFGADDRAGEPRQFELARATACRFLDDDQLLVGHMTGQVTLLDVTNGQQRFHRQLEYDPVYALAPSPDGKRVAVAFRSSRVQLLDPASGATTRVLHGHRDSVYGLAWLDAGRLAGAGKDKRLLVWDLAEPEPRVLYQGDRYITALAADRPRGRLAFTLEGERVGVIDTASGRVTHVLERHTAPVQVLLFADEGRTLLSAGNDARVLVWDVSGGGAP